MDERSNSNGGALEKLMADSVWLHGVASRLGCHSQAADDAVQDTLLAALHAEGEPRGRGWLRTVLRNGVGMERRATGRRRRREETVARSEVDLSDPAELLEQIDLGERLRLAVAALPRKEREVIALRFGAGLGPKEISETLAAR